MMHLLMQTADAVVGRPGTGTTSEAIISGCPIIFNALGGFMPQEWITMRYAQRHGLAETVHRAEQLPPILAGWRAEPERLAALRQAMLDCRPAAHPTDVLRLVRDCAATLPPELSPRPEAAAPHVQLVDERAADHAVIHPRKHLHEAAK